MKQVLIINEYFFPGYKGGRPIRSILNIIHYLKSEYSFTILARDRDLGDHCRYQGIAKYIWSYLVSASVYYCTPGELRIIRWRKIINKIDYDLIYLNSYFSRLTIRTLLLRRLDLVKKRPIVLAPRGEFAKEAIKRKAYRKKIYIILSQMLSLNRNIIWHASTDDEVSDIKRVFGIVSNKIVLAKLPIEKVPDPFVRDGHNGLKTRIRPKKEPGAIRIVFLSRIVKNKNLLLAINLLSGISGSIEFNIYGPCEDRAYWNKCYAAIKKLPNNIRAIYHGGVLNEEVTDIFSEHHLLLFPTLSESFGHVISTGCMVLISDRTPWRNLDKNGVGKDIPLENTAEYKRMLSMFVDMNNNEYMIRETKAKNYIDSIMAQQQKQIREAYAKLFEKNCVR
jgi:glycosyltransferase involved in cell wall biosynthesis